MKRRIAGDDEQPLDAGQAGDDVFDHAVDEIVLLGISAHVLERQHRDRRPVRQRQRRAGVGAGAAAAGANAIDAHRLCDVLELLLAHVGHVDGKLALDLLKSIVRKTNRARRGQRLDPCGDVDAVAVDVALVDDDIADVDADAEFDAAVFGNVRIALGGTALRVEREAHRVDGAGEFHQRAVAGGLDDAAVMFGNLGMEQFAPDRLYRGKGAFLVGAHHAAIADHIGGEDSGQAPGDTLLSHETMPRSRLAQILDRIQSMGGAGSSLF